MFTPGHQRQTQRSRPEPKRPAGFRVRWHDHGQWHEQDASNVVTINGHVAPRHTGTGYSASGGYVTACYHAKDRDCWNCRLDALMGWVRSVEEWSGETFIAHAKDPAHEREAYGFSDPYVFAPGRDW